MLILQNSSNRCHAIISDDGRCTVFVISPIVHHYHHAWAIERLPLPACVRLVSRSKYTEGNWIAHQRWLQITYDHRLNIFWKTVIRPTETWNNMHIMFYCSLHQAFPTYGSFCDLYRRKYLVPIFSVCNRCRVGSLSILVGTRCGQNKLFAGAIGSDVSCASHWNHFISLNRNCFASALEPIQIAKNEEMSDWWGTPWRRVNIKKVQCT